MWLYFNCVTSFKIAKEQLISKEHMSQGEWWIHRTVIVPSIYKGLTDACFTHQPTETFMIDKIEMFSLGQKIVMILQVFREVITGSQPHVHLMIKFFNIINNCLAASLILQVLKVKINVQKFIDILLK